MEIEIPPEDIKPNERIGRRAFGADNDIFEEVKGVRLYKVSVFIDTRPGDLSVDRLGINSPIKKQVGFLSPLAAEMGDAMKPPVEFKGWVQLKVSDVKSGVLKTEAVGEDNPFHAEIKRDKHQTKEAQRSLAFELCHLALKWEFVPRKPVPRITI